jgi:chromosome segregation protein
MRVERIELIGFKSFAEKTVFNFHPGLTAIVGPNGCGKSNIVDAFKWVLGEQSAKSLRGDSMEDVIFSGSATKKTKGMSEVTLVLTDIAKQPSNGSDNEGKVETTKVSVSRRLFRSGESEYLMNKVPCRLKDIRNMFLDTGLELKAYSILEQGRIDNIINAKPLDRRFLIEEVAGVMKYKVRKNEAMNKLEASKSNLQRLQDIIAEVKRQINTIDRHARKAERYKKLFEEIKEIEVRIAKRNTRTLKGQLDEHELQENELKSREAEVSAHMHSTEATMEEKKRLCVEHERSLNEVKNRFYSLERETTEDEGKIALLKQDCENLGERISTLLKQENELSVEKGNAENLIKEIEVDREEMTLKLSNHEDTLNDKNGVVDELERGISEEEQKLEEQRKLLFKRAEDLSTTRNEVNQLNLMIHNIGQKTEKSSQDIRNLSDSMSSLSTTIGETEVELKGAESSLQNVMSQKEQLAGQLIDRKSELDDREEILYRDRESLAGVISKLESMKELDRSQRSGTYERVKALCQVADIFETPAEYETALEAILRDKLSAAVVQDQSEITNALKQIREKNDKRSGFISLDPSRLTRGDDLKDNLLSEKGVIGKAMKYVTVKAGYEKVASSLIDDVILVDNLDAAFALCSKPVGSPVYFVTLNGEVLEPTGMVFGGSDKGVLKIKRMIKELENKIILLKGKIADAESTVARLKEDIVNTENEIISVNGNISSEEKLCHELKIKIKNLNEEKGRIEQKHEYITLEMTDDEREKESLHNSLSEKKSFCDELEEEKGKIEEEIRTVHMIIADKRESLDHRRSELTEIKLMLTALTEKMASILREKERLGSAIEDIEKKKVDIGEEKNNIEVLIGSKEKEILEKEENLKSKVILIGELQTEISEMGEILDARNSEVSLIEKQQKELTLELNGVRSELNSVEKKKIEEDMKLSYIIEDIRKTYAIEIESSDVDENITPEREEGLPGLKEKLKAIGPVSLGTLDEYEELKSRFEFLSKQRDDLLQSIEALEDTIQKINRTSQKRLAEAFEALNEKFKEVFTILFGKGKAELHLTEGSILDAGIDIVAQPPGKRLQNLMLLSGGEKALTALSLLFAGFMIKPTPLCLLDEVDAPLDESNTDRFIKLLRQLSKEIQFIAITHNRRTMEAADYLYGITMEEPGSSKVVSMHLAEAV